jgi:large conductance mechanosensitive channel
MSVIKEFKEFALKGNVVDLAIGVIINTVIDFTLVAFCVFMIVKVMNSLKRKPAPAAPAAPPEPSREEKLLGEIRDILKARA